MTITLRYKMNRDGIKHFKVKGGVSKPSPVVGAFFGCCTSGRGDWGSPCPRQTSRAHSRTTTRSSPGWTPPARRTTSFHPEPEFTPSRPVTTCYLSWVAEPTVTWLNVGRPPTTRQWRSRPSKTTEHQPNGLYMRSPEVLLGAPFTEAIDIWSVGCIAAFLYTGALLYPGKSEYDMVRYIVETQGQPPDNVLEAGLQTSCFFQMEHNFSWKLKTPEQYQKETTSVSKETRRFKFRSLDRLLHFQPGILNTRHIVNKAAKTADVQKFVELLKGMLELDATQRLTPRQVLEHDFSSMSHLEPLHDTSSHVQSCFHIMSVCSNKEQSLQSLGGTGFDPSELNEMHDDEPCCGSPASPEVYEIMAHDERSDPS
ncbi:homeodomain-interacting protein kinase 1-like isoform X2 [Syngnathoides biaculeatus]|uniref:homeodomain-interacting protein kinase 1-like isoform X2 n=1 Tax=Syngnathoides biaculeatus TaxID=300417 RepID=UPI002ADE2A8E|nr:homeodomain-interacting protein kinase 1-like isoform X2 [Syngnathoides biaculeatus]